MTQQDLRERAAGAGQRTDRPPSSEVATPEQPQKRSLIQMINDLKPELANALPRHVSVDRVARIAVTALRQNVALGKCTPESFLGALMTASQLGLEVNTPAGESYLIPYGKECTLVVGYQGIVKLFWQSPHAKHIDAQAVHANDHFDYEYGLNPRLEHKPATGDRGEVVAYYAVATLQNGGSAFVVLTPEQVKELRQGKVGPSGNIADPMRWMDKKTALKQMLKLLPKTVELDAALKADEQVRTNFADTLEGMQVRPLADDPAHPVVEVTPEQPAATAEQPADTPSGEQPTGETPVQEEPSAPADTATAEQPHDQAEQTAPADGQDGCPACGEVPSHQPADCPMGGDPSEPQG